MKLYLADDDQDDCLLFEEALSELSLGVSLSVFNDGNALLDAMVPAHGKGPDLVFLDMNMPGKNGLQCLKIIKSSAFFSEVPVVIFSTSVDESIARSVLEMGAHGFIRKPSSYADLKKTIRETLAEFPGR